MGCYEDLLKIKEEYKDEQDELIKNVNRYLEKNPCGEFTLAEIGEILGLSRERIRQIEVQALKKLKHPKIGGKLKED